ncbi:MAG TPA: DUF6184 family natural product biosynthesis lipoprotein [Polyangiaceae bacterium]|jgi:hypothetical protein|nr:DUF6184 family natural product biosynthesis lipoprotein [Polyangiaceae bacterium]
MRYASTVFLLAVAGALRGCAGAHDDAMTPASLTTPGTARAVEAIASTRCSHEQRCHHIAASARYESEEQCMNAMRREADRTYATCRQGVDQDDLRECLDRITEENCEASGAHFERVMACRAAEVCLK